MSAVDANVTRVNLLAPAVPLGVAARGVDVVALPGGLWRITGREGRVLGHVEVVEDASGRRYRSKRFMVRDRRFRILGEFGRPEDAVDAVRFG
jgi:hypothetical protein